MTIRRNPNRGNQEERNAFVGPGSLGGHYQAPLLYPRPLHHQLKMMTLAGHINMTALVIEALKNFVGEHQR